MQGVDALHDQGLAHVDLKAENILCGLDTLHCTVLDPGSAKPDSCKLPVGAVFGM